MTHFEKLSFLVEVTFKSPPSSLDVNDGSSESKIRKVLVATSTMGFLCEEFLY